MGRAFVMKVNTLRDGSIGRGPGRGLAAGEARGPGPSDPREPGLTDRVLEQGPQTWKSMGVSVSSSATSGLPRHALNWAKPLSFVPLTF